MALVIDTNILIAHLNLVSEIVPQASSYGFDVVIPWTVLAELDRQKQRNSYPARTAVKWIHAQLSDSIRGLRAQKLFEVTQAGLSGDDSILDCCLYLARTEKIFTALVSDDRNLCNRALAEEIPTVSWSSALTSAEIAREMGNRLGSRMVEDTSENMDARDSDMVDDVEMEIDTAPARTDSKNIVGDAPSDRDIVPETLDDPPSTSIGPFARDVRRVLVANVITLINIRMRQAFDLQEQAIVGYKKPDDLQDVIKVIKRHKIAVFSPFLAGLPLDSLLDTPFSTSRKDLLAFTAAWTEIGVRLAKNDFPALRAAIEQTSQAVHKYFT